MRTRIPTLLAKFREKDASLKVRQKRDFDSRHSAKTLPDLLPGERVCLPDQTVEGTVADSWYPAGLTPLTLQKHN